MPPSESLKQRKARGPLKSGHADGKGRWTIGRCLGASCLQRFFDPALLLLEFICCHICGTSSHGRLPGPTRIAPGSASRPPYADHLQATCYTHLHRFRHAFKHGDRSSSQYLLKSRERLSTSPTAAVICRRRIVPRPPSGVIIWYWTIVPAKTHLLFKSIAPRAMA